MLKCKNRKEIKNMSFISAMVWVAEIVERGSIIYFWHTLRNRRKDIITSKQAIKRYLITMVVMIIPAIILSICAALS